MKTVKAESIFPRILLGYYFLSQSRCTGTFLCWPGGRGRHLRKKQLTRCANLVPELFMEVPTDRRRQTKLFHGGDVLPSSRFRRSAVQQIGHGNDVRATGRPFISRTMRLLMSGYRVNDLDWKIPGMQQLFADRGSEIPDEPVQGLMTEVWDREFGMQA